MNLEIVNLEPNRLVQEIVRAENCDIHANAIPTFAAILWPPHGHVCDVMYVTFCGWLNRTEMILVHRGLNFVTSLSKHLELL